MLVALLLSLSFEHNGNDESLQGGFVARLYLGQHVPCVYNAAVV